MANKKVFIAKSEAEMWGYIKGKHTEQKVKGHFVNPDRVASKPKVDQSFVDLYTDGCGNCYSDADPGL